MPDRRPVPVTIAPTADPTLPDKRHALYADAKSAHRLRESAAEWEESVAACPVLGRAADSIGEREMRAIVAMVWKVDRRRGA